MVERGSEQQPTQEGKAMERKEYTLADVKGFLREELSMSEALWDPEATEATSGKSVDWERDIMLPLANAIEKLEHGDPSLAQGLIDKSITGIRRSVEAPYWNWRAGLAPTDPMRREKDRQASQEYLEKLEALRRALG